LRSRYFVYFLGWSEYLDQGYEKNNRMLTATSTSGDERKVKHIIFIPGHTL